MRHITVLLCFFLSTVLWAQNDSITKISEIQIIPDTLAEYPGGIRAFRSYISNNFNFHNVSLTDLSESDKTKANYIIYIGFMVDEEGKPAAFKPENTSEENSFYKEAVRVVASTRWQPAIKNGIRQKQYFVIPLQIYIEDLF